MKTAKVKSSAASNTQDSRSAAGSTSKYLKMCCHPHRLLRLTMWHQPQTFPHPQRHQKCYKCLHLSLSSCTCPTELPKQISKLKSKLFLLSNLKSLGFATAENIKQLNMVRVDLHQAPAKLRYFIWNIKKQKKCSAEKKTLVMKLAAEMNQTQYNYVSSLTAPLVDLQLETRNQNFSKQFLS